MFTQELVRDVVLKTRVEYMCTDHNAWQHKQAVSRLFTLEKGRPRDGTTLCHETDPARLHETRRPLDRETVLI